MQRFHSHMKKCKLPKHLSCILNEGLCRALFNACFLGIENGAISAIK